MRSRGLWLLLLALLGCGAAWMLITLEEDSASREGASLLAGGDEEAEFGAALEGADVDATIAAASPYAQETDWRTLLAAVGPTQPPGAFERLVALARSDPALVRQLVALLHPRHAQLTAPGRGAVTNQVASAVALPGDPPLAVWRGYIVEVLTAVGAPAVPALGDALADSNEEFLDSMNS